MAEVHPDIRAIFCEALELKSADEVERYLDRVCQGDDQLRQEVLALLGSHREAGNFLGGVPTGHSTIEQLPIVERPGTMIGPYKLLQQIGEGGFGVVFLAEQERPVRRRVALKVIKPGMDTREVIARFEAERQALALMDHPSIAKVHDAGTTENGRPYFVMELVQGVPITEYCDQCNLTTKERLELFISVCQAVQHAHQKGIIHRDIKPTNVLVAMQDGQPAPKIIDFGVAKALSQRLTEHTLMTAFAQMVGTPLYMSPEQAELSPLGVDTRSDIYSLGVLLYELLTGTTPFDKERLYAASYDELRRIIREEEPPRPSARISTLAADRAVTVAERRRTDARRLQQTVRGELDWIVMKCLEKDRNRRYESAGSVARDIERYLHDEPVQACPPSAAYRFKKFIRRNKIAAAFVLLLMVAVATLGVSNIQTRRNERRANTESAKANAISNLLQQMLASSNPDEVKGADYTVRQLLDDFSERVGTELSGQPEIEAEIRATVGKAYWRLVVTDQAELHLKRALELRRSLFGPDHEKVADSLVDYAWNLAEQNRHAEAETATRDALRIYRTRGTAAPQVILAKSGLQRFLISMGRYYEARGVAEEALALARSAGDDYPVVANILHDMADADNKQGHYAEAEQKARQAVALHRRLHEAGHPETAWGLATLGASLFHQKKYAEAEDALREALAIFRKSYGNYHKATNFVREDLIKLLEARGDEVGIRNLMTPALDEIKTRTNHGMFASWMDQGRIHTKLGQWDDAIHAFREACAINPSDAAVHFDLGAALQNTGRFDEALDIFKDYIELKPDDAAGYARLGSCLRQSGRIDDAVTSYRKAIDLEPNFGLAYDGLAYTLCEQSKFDEAEAATRKAIELSPNDPVAYILLGRAVHGLGKLDEAHAAWRRGIELQADAYTLIDMAWRLATAPNPKHRDAAWSVKLATKAAEMTPKDGTLWSVLGVAEYRAGQLQKAVAALEKAMQMRDGGDASDWFVLAMVHWQLGQKEDARTSYEKGVQLTKKNKPYDEVLERFRAEAAELLEITEPRPPADLKSHSDNSATGIMRLRRHHRLLTADN